MASCLGPAADNDTVIETVFDPCLPTDIRAAEGTSAEELVAIDAAIRLWHDVARVDMARDLPGADQKLNIRFEDAALVFHGLYEDEVGDVIINRRLADADDRAITVAHEFGHALGLPHIETRDSVMNSGNLKWRPLSTDADALGELWGPCVRDSSDPQSDEDTN